MIQERRTHGREPIDHGRPSPQGRGLKIAYIIGTYPSLTTTFIDREIRGLRELGVTLQVLAIRRPRMALSAAQRALQQGVLYLLPVSLWGLIIAHLTFALRQPRDYFGTLRFLLTRPHPDMGARVKTLLHFGEGVYAAHRLRDQQWDHLHAHFVDRAATVALVVSRLLGVPYSVTAHANDIYVRPVLLPEKLGNARFVATCTGYNQAHLAERGLGEGKVVCIYHGLDVSRYRPAPPHRGNRPRLLAVGQLKEKKGFTYLLEACAILRERGYAFDCQIVGEGPLRATLEEKIRRLGLGETVALRGALPHEAVIEAYRQASLFVLPCVVGRNGDRDGIPNVILEAMAMQLPVVSTRTSGIPEVVEEGRNGLLVPPANAGALAEALAHLLDEPGCWPSLGQQGRRTVVERFDIERNVGRLLGEFQATRAAAVGVGG